jgi:hypothetical protein
MNKNMESKDEDKKRPKKQEQDFKGKEPGAYN